MKSKLPWKEPLTVAWSACTASVVRTLKAEHRFAPSSVLHIKKCNTVVQLNLTHDLTINDKIHLLRFCDSIAQEVRLVLLYLLYLLFNITWCLHKKHNINKSKIIIHYMKLHYFNFQPYWNTVKNHCVVWNKSRMPKHVWQQNKAIHRERCVWL